jgi:NADH-quinone oxidoreductase subunit J
VEISAMILACVALAAVIVGGAVTAVLSKNLLRAAVALGVGSAALATLFFLLNAPYAGGFELSVGAGLISVLFIIAISLTESMRRQDREP